MPDCTGPDSIRSIIAAHTPQEAAALLNHLEGGAQAAWQAQHEARFTPQAQTRFATAAELDALRLDTWWATVETACASPENPWRTSATGSTTSPARTPSPRRAADMSTSAPACANAASPAFL
jgi:hypothetical protein